MQRQLQTTHYQFSWSLAYFSVLESIRYSDVFANYWDLVIIQKNSHMELFVIQIYWVNYNLHCNVIILFLWQLEVKSSKNGYPTSSEIDLKKLFMLKRSTNLSQHILNKEPFFKVVCSSLILEDQALNLLAKIHRGQRNFSSIVHQHYTSGPICMLYHKAQKSRKNKPLYMYWIYILNT